MRCLVFSIACCFLISGCYEAPQPRSGGHLDGRMFIIGDGNLDIVVDGGQDSGGQGMDAMTKADIGVPAKDLTPTKDGAKTPLCAPCSSSAECGSDNYCLVNSKTGEKFCGVDCLSGKGCPDGFLCLFLNTGIAQCVPPSGTCKSGGDGGVAPDSSSGLDFGSQPGCGHTAIEHAVFNLLNQERANHGLKMLKCDPYAVMAARKYSQQMCTDKHFSHTGADGSTPQTRLKAAGANFTYCGENIAAGQKTAEAVHASWMSSSGHRANMLSSYWDRVGIGYADCPGWISPLWTENFLY